MSLNGRRALVTAASSGIGLAVAERLAAAGAEVFISGRDPERTGEVAERIGARGHALADFKFPEQTDALARAALEQLGGVDILFSNAGAPPASSFVDLDQNAWEDAYRLLLDSALRLTRATLPGMRKNGWGRLIYLTSSGVIRPLPALHLSNVMRAGVAALAHSIVHEVGADGVTTHVLAPAHIDTERKRSMSRFRAEHKGVEVTELEQRELQTVAMGRWGTAEDVGAAVEFLCSRDADFMTGETLAVDGGFSHAIPL